MTKVATGDRLMQSLVVGAGAEVFSPERIIEVGRVIDCTLPHSAPLCSGCAPTHGRNAVAATFVGGR